MSIEPQKIYETESKQNLKTFAVLLLAGIMAFTVLVIGPIWLVAQMLPGEFFSARLFLIGSTALSTVFVTYIVQSLTWNGAIPLLPNWRKIFPFINYHSTALHIIAFFLCYLGIIGLFGSWFRLNYLHSLEANYIAWSVEQHRLDKAKALKERNLAKKHLDIMQNWAKLENEGKILLKKKKYQEALNIFKTLLSANPNATTIKNMVKTAGIGIEHIKKQEAELRAKEKKQIALEKTIRKTKLKGRKEKIYKLAEQFSSTLSHPSRGTTRLNEWSGMPEHCTGSDWKYSMKWLNKANTKAKVYVEVYGKFRMAGKSGLRALHYYNVDWSNDSFICKEDKNGNWVIED